MDSKNNIENYLYDEFILVNSGFSLKSKNGYKKALNHLDSKYFRNTSVNKNHLEEDLMILKTYRDYLENYEKGLDSISTLVVVYISIRLGLLSSNVKGYIYDLVSLLILFLIICAFTLYKTSGCSKNNKARKINKLIYKLESIEKNINNSKKLRLTNNKKIASIKVKKDIPMKNNTKKTKEVVPKLSNGKNIFGRKITQIKNFFGKGEDEFNLSFKINEKLNAQLMNAKEIRQYINLNYLINNDNFTNDNLVNDLRIFKHLEDDLELNLDDDKTFINTLVVLTSITSTMLLIQFEIISSESKILAPMREKITPDSIGGIYRIAGILFLFTILYLGISYLLRVRKKSSFSKLKSVKFAIKELEAIKEEMDRKSNNFKNQVHKGRGKKWLTNHKLW